MGENIKGELVSEICCIAAAFASCTHRRCTPQMMGFVDWYLILRVDEDVGTEAIRRGYRQLALQLHPDKNHHPKAEVAFKLISEAHECLVDKFRRRVFNLERRKSYCKECHEKLLTESLKEGCHRATEQTKFCRVPQARKEARKKLQEECEVIKNYMSFKNKASGGESPLFDPSDRRTFPDYPYHMTRVYAKPWDSRYFDTNRTRSSCGRTENRCESPVYEIKIGKQKK